jgi:hypothetical protein
LLVTNTQKQFSLFSSLQQTAHEYLLNDASGYSSGQRRMVRTGQRKGSQRHCFLPSHHNRFVPCSNQPTKVLVQARVRTEDTRQDRGHPGRNEQSKKTHRKDSPRHFLSHRLSHCLAQAECLWKTPDKMVRECLLRCWLVFTNDSPRYFHFPSVPLHQRRQRREGFVVCSSPRLTTKPFFSSPVPFGKHSGYKNARAWKHASGSTAGGRHTGW